MPRIGIGLPIGRHNTKRRQRTITLNNKQFKVVVSQSFYWGELSGYNCKVTGEGFSKKYFNQGINPNPVTSLFFSIDEMMEKFVSRFTEEYTNLQP